MGISFKNTCFMDYIIEADKCGYWRQCGITTSEGDVLLHNDGKCYTEHTLGELAWKSLSNGNLNGFAQWNIVYACYSLTDRWKTDIKYVGGFCRTARHVLGAKRASFIGPKYNLSIDTCAFGFISMLENKDTTVGIIDVVGENSSSSSGVGAGFSGGSRTSTTTTTTSILTTTTTTTAEDYASAAIAAQATVDASNLNLTERDIDADENESCSSTSCASNDREWPLLTDAFPVQENINATAPKKHKTATAGKKRTVSKIDDDESDDEIDFGDDDEDEDDDEDLDYDVKSSVTFVNQAFREIIMWPTAGVSFNGGLGFPSGKLAQVRQNIIYYDIEFLKDRNFTRPPIKDDMDAEGLYTLSPDADLQIKKPYTERFITRLNTIVLSNNFPILDIEKYRKFVLRIAEWLFLTLADPDTTDLRFVGRFLYYILSNSSLLTLLKKPFFNNRGPKFPLLKMGLFDKNTKVRINEESKVKRNEAVVIETETDLIKYEELLSSYINSNTDVMDDIGLGKLIRTDTVHTGMSKKTILLHTLFDYLGERMVCYAKHAHIKAEAQRRWNAHDVTVDDKKLISELNTKKREYTDDKVKELIYSRFYLSAKDAVHDSIDGYVSTILKKYLKVLAYAMSYFGSNDVVFDQNPSSFGDFMKVILSINPFGESVRHFLNDELDSTRNEFNATMQQIFLLKISYSTINSKMLFTTRVSSVRAQASQSTRRKLVTDDDEDLIITVKDNSNVCTFSLYTDRMKHILNAFLNVVRPGVERFELLPGESNQDALNNIVIEGLTKLRDAFFVELSNFERLRARITTDSEDIKNFEVFKYHFSVMMTLYYMTIDTLRFHVERSVTDYTSCDYWSFWDDKSRAIFTDIFDFYTAKSRQSQRGIDLFVNVKKLSDSFNQVDKYPDQITFLKSFTIDNYTSKMEECWNALSKSMVHWHSARDNIAENRPDLLVFGFDKLPVFVSTRFDKLASVLSFASTVVRNVKHSVTFCKQPETFHQIVTTSSNTMDGDRDKRFCDLQKRASVLQLQPLFPLENDHNVGLKAFGRSMFVMSVNQKKLFADDAESYVDRLNLVAHRVFDNNSFSPDFLGTIDSEPMLNMYKNDWTFDLVHMKLLSARLGILKNLDSTFYDSIVTKYDNYIKSRKLSVNLRVNENAIVASYLNGEKKSLWTFDVVNREKFPEIPEQELSEDQLTGIPYVPALISKREIDLYSKTNGTLSLEAVIAPRIKLMKSSLDVVHALTDVVDSDFCGYYQRVLTFVSDDVSIGIKGASRNVRGPMVQQASGAVIQALYLLYEKTDITNNEKMENARSILGEYESTQSLASNDKEFFCSIICMPVDIMDIIFTSGVISDEAKNMYNEFRELIKINKT